jgi:hypothetical protein
MERKKDQGSDARRREPESWVPEEHVITATYPEFPPHFVHYPHVKGEPDLELNVSCLVNRVCRQAAVSRRQVIGGLGRKGVSMKVVSNFEIECALACFGPLHSSSAYEALMAILDEYPRSEGTDHLRRLIDATATAYCRGCGVKFNVRLPHACTKQDLARHRREMAKCWRSLDRVLMPRAT